MKNVLAKLQEARMKLIAQPIKKGARNEFAKYNYMELADFLVPAQQIFNELKMNGLVSFTHEIATLTITDLESGEQVSITSPMSTAALRGCHEVQNLGAVQTYLRRYLWVAALEIVEHDAIDSSPPVEADKEKRVRLPTLTDEEAQYEYDAWVQFKASVDHDTDKVNAAWKDKPSNVRTAIRRIGDQLQQEQK